MAGFAGYHEAMNFAANWPVILVALAAFVVLAGVLRKLAKLAFVGVALGAIGLFLWPLVNDAYYS